MPRVKALAPNAKLIVMLRDPVARAYSQYQMVVDPEGTPEQKKARGTHWVGKTFEEVGALAASASASGLGGRAWVIDEHASHTYIHHLLHESRAMNPHTPSQLTTI